MNQGQYKLACEVTAEEAGSSEDVKSCSVKMEPDVLETDDRVADVEWTQRPTDDEELAIARAAEEQEERAFANQEADYTEPHDESSGDEAEGKGGRNPFSISLSSKSRADWPFETSTKDPFSPSGTQLISPY